MYMDTSAAAKIYFREEASDAVQRLASECGPLTSAEILVTEMTSVASRKYAKQLCATNIYLFLKFRAHVSVPHLPSDIA